MSFLSDLYCNKGWSLRRISKELGCAKGTVRKKLFDAGIEVCTKEDEGISALQMKIQEMRARGMSYQAIADAFNLWRIPTRSREGKWFSKTIKDLC